MTNESLLRTPTDMKEDVCTTGRNSSWSSRDNEQPALHAKILCQNPTPQTRFLQPCLSLSLFSPCGRTLPLFQEIEYRTCPAVLILDLGPGDRCIVCLPAACLPAVLPACHTPMPRGVGVPCANPVQGSRTPFVPGTRPGPARTIQVKFRL